KEVFRHEFCDLVSRLLGSVHELSPGDRLGATLSTGDVLAGSLDPGRLGLHDSMFALTSHVETPSRESVADGSSRRIHCRWHLSQSVGARCLLDHRWAFGSRSRSWLQL